MPLQQCLPSQVNGLAENLRRHARVPHDRQQPAKKRHEPGLRNRLVEGGIRTLGRYSEGEIMRGIIGMYRELKIEN